MTKNEAIFTPDRQQKTITVTRIFDAELEQVWEAWTESEILDKWWGPKPYHVETKTMDFREGGHWIYCMVGPEGDNSWCREDYQIIEPRKKIVNDVNFCNDQGTLTYEFPTMHWQKEFSANGGTTTVSILIRFDNEGDMDKIVAMGFEEGFTAGLNNFDEVLT